MSPKIVKWFQPLQTADLFLPADEAVSVSGNDVTTARCRVRRSGIGKGWEGSKEGRVVVCVKVVKRYEDKGTAS